MYLINRKLLCNQYGITKNCIFRTIASTGDNFSYLVRNHDNCNQPITFGIGKLGHLSQSSVLCRYGDTVIHSTVNSSSVDSGDNSGDGSVPLTVDYRARHYAFGSIPQNRNRREIHGNSEEILIARCIDRAVRPLFPKIGYIDDVQITVTAHATDGTHDPIVAAVNAASCSLLFSQQPWNGPIGCVRVGLVNDKLKINPTVDELAIASFDMLYAGRQGSILMMEANGNQTDEGIVRQAMLLANSEILNIIRSQEELQRQLLGEANVRKKSPISIPQELQNELETYGWNDSLYVYGAGLDSKECRGILEGKLRHSLIEWLDRHEQWNRESPIVRSIAVDLLLRKAFRYIILHGSVPNNGSNIKSIVRSDGRNVKELRSISCAVDVLPVVHGSAFFARGDTHVLSTVTLGPKTSARRYTPIDGSSPHLDKDCPTYMDSTGIEHENGEKIQNFMLHYDFPPYATGEIGNATAVNRRSLGHGNLAEKAIRPLIPVFNDFPYAIRVFAECTSSNGSSSMASVCAGSLALFDAGVPMKAAAAGVSVGLVTETDAESKDKNQEKVSDSNNGIARYVLMKDILGSEDHHGDMDFKVAGTESGITAIQLDVKLAGGVPFDIISEALDVAKEGRIEILQVMGNEKTHVEGEGSIESLGEGLASPRCNVKPQVTKAAVVKFDPDRKSVLVGTGGEMLKHIMEMYNVTIDVDTVEGTAYIYGQHSDKVTACRMLVEDIAILVKEGDILTATVSQVKDFGLIVCINRAQEALLHISDITHDPNLLKTPLKQLAKPGQQMKVKVLKVDSSTGLVKVSRKVLLDMDSTDTGFGEVPKDEVSSSAIAPDFPTSPPKRYKRDYFRINVATEE